MTPRRISTITIEPASAKVKSLPRGPVALTFRADQPDERALWETWLVGGVFDFLAAKRGLPRVAFVGEPYGGGGGLGWGPGVRPLRPGPERATASAEAVLAQRIRAAAKDARAEVAGLEILRPYGLAPAITLEVDDPAAFLRYRLESFRDRLPRSGESEGTYLWIVDSHGRYVWSQGSATRGGPGAGGVRPGLEACSPDIWTLPAEAPEPPPCPA